MSSRPTPFDLVFGALAEERFPAIADACRAGSVDIRNRDALLLVREMVALLRDLRPDEGIGDGTDEFVAFVHHAFVFWVEGAEVRTVEGTALAALLDGTATELATAPDRACYILVAERRLWARPLPDDAHEPLDGCFLMPGPDGTLRVLGAFGVHPQRLGLTVVEAAGPRPAGLAREDGTPLFAPRLPGGSAAGLHEVIGAEELLELGWRLWLTTRD